MGELYFLSTLLAIVLLAGVIVVRLLRRKPVSNIVGLLLSVAFLYMVLWMIFYSKCTNTPVALGTDVCFDDWCATVTSYERVDTIGDQVSSGQFVILTIKMTNKARGIAQKPSEPRVHIVDDHGTVFSPSSIGQQALEQVQGQFLPLDQRLELHQSLETKLVFDVPKNNTNLAALIEEGPFITKLLLQGDNQVFQLP